MLNISQINSSKELGNLGYRPREISKILYLDIMTAIAFLCLLKKMDFYSELEKHQKTMTDGRYSLRMEETKTPQWCSIPMMSL